MQRKWQLKDLQAIYSERGCFVTKICTTEGGGVYIFGLLGITFDIYCLLNNAFQSFHAYGDLFPETWKAFSDYDIIHLKTYDSKRVRTHLVEFFDSI